VANTSARYTDGYRRETADCIISTGRRGELARLTKGSRLEPGYAGVLARFDEPGLSWS